MNIKQAKEQVKNAVRSYLTKNEFGDYAIPIERQRPIFMMGPPGIGKTAVMEQIASELNIGLVSYSMTHHTRQSALGLPFITTKTYGGREFEVSEYTMSEIIASVYDMMETAGVREGILFLDEINCVSETLAPSMLQFLQYKIFGRHRVPDGWIVVTAGNPPEYNNSVREFDIVTWDRLKRIDVEPDYATWKEYAYRKGVHASIMTYLEIKNSDFYMIETTVDGKRFVTARGWTDLSDMIQLYEKHGITVDETLVVQYLQDPGIAKGFAIYYDLFNKYKSDYQVDAILEGKETGAIEQRAREAKFDERLSLLGLLLDGIGEKLRAVCRAESAQLKLLSVLKSVRLDLTKASAEPRAVLEKHISLLENELANGRRSSSMSEDDQHSCRSVISALESESEAVIKQGCDAKNAFDVIRKDFDDRTKAMKASADSAGKQLSNMFRFCENVFGEGQEMLILVTEITMNYYGSHFISRYGCKEYFAHNKELLFYERQKEIIAGLDDLDLKTED